MSTPESKPAAARRKQLTVTKLAAAKAQFESAIWLWFTQDDPISVHALVVAAHDCYHALAAQQGKPSFIGEFLKTRSKEFQKRAAYTQNFFKHGFKNLSGSASLDTITTDALIVDCMFCHKDLQLKITPMIQLFWFRALIEQPGLLAAYDSEPFAEQFQRHQLDRMSRQEFLNEFLPHVTRFLASKDARKP